MSEKVKVTPKQAERLNQIHFPSDLVSRYVNKKIQHDDNKCLLDLTLDELIRSLYIGYEVEEEFKKNDWVYHIEFHNIGIVEGITEDDFIRVDSSEDYVWNTKYTRHATEQEIAQEKKRRFWAGIDREVDEYKVGDIVQVIYYGVPIFIEVSDVTDNLVFNRDVPFPKEDTRLVTPADKRFDK